MMRLRACRTMIFPPPIRTVDKGHGRIETRSVQTSTCLQGYLTWPYAVQVFRIERHVTDLRGATARHEVAFGITDLSETEASAAVLGSLVRGHWEIETRLHYVRDMTYDEDRSQVRTRNGPHNMATLRNMAIGLLRRMKVNTISRAVAHLERHPDRVADLLGCA